MQITEVRIKLMDEPGDRLKAFCSVTFDDCFVIRDLKIIEGSTGPFVAMPSRKLTSHCRKCGTKNHLRALYCNQCGTRQEEGRAPKDHEGRAKLYADIAHPINSQCREMIQEFVIGEYFDELERSKQPGYVPRYDDYDFEYADTVQTKPTRVDQPHGDSIVSQPHVAPDTQQADSSVGQGPHYRTDPPAGDPATRDPAPPKNDGFGAGIFPEQ